MVDISFSEVGVEVRGFNKAQEELVHDLQVGPREFEDRLVFFGIECITSRVDRRGYRTEEVGCKLYVANA